MPKTRKDKNNLYIYDELNKINRSSFEIETKDYGYVWHLMISGMYVYYGHPNPFVSGVDIPKKFDISNLTYVVSEDSYLITIPRKKSSFNSLFTINFNFKNLFNFNNKELPEKPVNDLEKLSLINSELHKEVLVLNQLIEENFFSGSSIKEKIKSEINDLIKKYLKIHENENLFNNVSLKDKDIFSKQKNNIKEIIDSLILKLLKEKEVSMNVRDNEKNINDLIKIYKEINK